MSKGPLLRPTVHVRPLLSGGPVGDEAVVGGGVVRSAVVPVARDGGRVGDEVMEVRHLAFILCLNGLKKKQNCCQNYILLRKLEPLSL